MEKVLYRNSASAICSMEGVDMLKDELIKRMPKEKDDPDTEILGWDNGYNQALKEVKEILGRVEDDAEELPKKFNGSDLCAVREDFGWWVGYDCPELIQEISATGKTLDKAFKKLNDYWFKSGRAKAI